MSCHRETISCKPSLIVRSSLSDESSTNHVMLIVFIKNEFIKSSILKSSNSRNFSSITGDLLSTTKKYQIKTWKENILLHSACYSTNRCTPCIDIAMHWLGRIGQNKTIFKFMKCVSNTNCRVPFILIRMPLKLNMEFLIIIISL